jgi:hypothetical protein
VKMHFCVYTPTGMFSIKIIRKSNVGIMTRLPAGRCGVRIPVETRNFSFPETSRPAPDLTVSSVRWMLEFFPGVKVAGVSYSRRTEPPPPSQITLSRTTFHTWNALYLVLPSYAYFSQQVLRVLYVHLITHNTQWDSSGRGIGPSQRPLPDNTNAVQETNIHAPGGIRTHDLSKPSAAVLRPRPRRHWDRHNWNMFV